MGNIGGLLAEAAAAADAMKGLQFIHGIEGPINTDDAGDVKLLGSRSHVCALQKV